jgi:hypothetical protein
MSTASALIKKREERDASWFACVAAYFGECYRLKNGSQSLICGMSTMKTLSLTQSIAKLNILNKPGNQSIDHRKSVSVIHRIHCQRQNFMSFSENFSCISALQWNVRMYTVVSTKELLSRNHRGRVEDPLPQRVFTHSKLRTGAVYHVRTLKS